MNLQEKVICRCIEAPRGGAGIEIMTALTAMSWCIEAPRGGAGIEMKYRIPAGAQAHGKPLVEGLVLKSAGSREIPDKPRKPLVEGLVLK